MRGLKLLNPKSMRRVCARIALRFKRAVDITAVDAYAFFRWTEVLGVSNVFNLFSQVFTILINLV